MRKLKRLPFDEVNPLSGGTGSEFERNYEMITSPDGSNLGYRKKTVLSIHEQNMLMAQKLDRIDYKVTVKFKSPHQL